jgi:tetratricopeptide (TPR) repeat protein
MKMKLFLGFFLGVSLVNTAFSQSLDNAKKMYVYERYKSAKAELEKLVAADAKNAEAQYWLVLTNLAMGDKVNARAIATAASTATGNSALSSVANGHVDLIENKKQEAKSKFETAISLSDKKNQVAILTAIGRAHGSVGISQSEPDYAIEKLNAAMLKEPKNSEIAMVLGDVYRRKLDGGNAVTNYMKAQQLDPRSGQASYKIGKVFKTQDNCSALTEHFTNATNTDPNFMPAWRELYDSYANDESNCFNIASARTYLDKYIQTADPGVEADRIKMTFCYFSKDYNCALTEANNIGTKYPEVATEMIMWKGYIYDKLNDSSKSLGFFNEYFAKQKDTSTISANVYRRAAEIAAKNLGQERTALTFYENFIAKSPEMKAKIYGYAKCAEINEKLKEYAKAADWYKLIIANKETPTSIEYYKGGLALYNSQDFNGGAEVFKMYAEKYPTDYRGSFWTARCYAQIDSTMKDGLAVPHYDKFITIAETDMVKNKTNLVEAIKYVFIYNVATKKDNATAKTYLDKLKLVDPTNGQIPELEGYISGKAQPPAPKPTTGTGTNPKPGTGTTPKPATGTGGKPATNAGAKPKTGGTSTPKTGTGTKATTAPVKKG